MHDKYALISTWLAVKVWDARSTRRMEGFPTAHLLHIEASLTDR